MTCPHMSSHVPYLLLVETGYLLQDLLRAQEVLQVVELRVGIGVVPGVGPGSILPLAALRRPAGRAGPTLGVEGVHGLHIPDGTTRRHAVVCPSSTLLEHSAKLRLNCVDCIVLSHRNMRLINGASSLNRRNWVMVAPR